MKNNLPRPMNPDEHLVFNLIANSDKITQLEISRSVQWLGSHPVHESHLPINHQQSTLRKIRQIIRNLRIIHGKMILSGINGYWIMKTDEEAQEYLMRLEKLAKAQSKAWFETYQAMKKNYNVTSEYFESMYKQSTLF